MMEAVVFTHGDAGTPHMEALRRSNPDMRVHVDSACRALSVNEGWRNPDRRIRAWWQANRETYPHDFVVFLEYDVLVNANLRGLLQGWGDRGIPDLIARQILRMENGYWCWFRERDALPKAVNIIRGVCPFAVVVLSRDLLDALASPRWDVLFAKDVFGELRLGSVSASMGFRLATHPLLRNCKPIAIRHPGTKPGIWHAVKTL